MRLRKAVNMKKLSIVLIAAFLLFTICGNAIAAGTVTVTRAYLSVDHSVLVVKLACVGDSSTGAVPNAALTEATVSAGLPYGYQKSGYFLYEVWTVAGTTTAPDAADITINDAVGAQLYDEDGIIAATGTKEGDVDKYRTVTSLLTVVTANQATASATWDVYLKFVKPFPGGNP